MIKAHFLDQRIGKYLVKSERLTGGWARQRSDSSNVTKMEQIGSNTGKLKRDTCYAIQTNG